MKRSIAKRFGWTFLILALFLSSCGNTGKHSEGSDSKAETHDLNLYFVNQEEDQLISEKFLPKQSDSSHLIDVFVKKASESSDYNEDAQPLLNEDVKIKSKSLTDGILTLNLNAEFESMSPARELLARAGLTKLFTQLDEVKWIKLTINGKPLVDSGGAEIAASGQDSFVENSGKSIHSYSNADMILYFTDQSGEKLVREEKNVYYSSNEPLEKAVVEQIIKGPSDSKNFPVLGSDTKVLSVAIQEGVCYVNFDDSFSNTLQNVKAEVQLYSIVNSLVNTCHVKTVKFSINGKSNLKFRNTMPLERQYEKTDVENTASAASAD